MINDPYINCDKLAAQHKKWLEKLHSSHCKLMNIAIELKSIQVNQYEDDLRYNVVVNGIKRTPAPHHETDIEFDTFPPNQGLEYTAQIYECPFCHKELPKTILKEVQHND